MERTHQQFFRSFPVYSPEISKFESNTISYCLTQMTDKMFLLFPQYLQKPIPIKS